ncbi:uncharacterized protein [Erythrolamprus reginae]|uniref:uncharacterized protein isoform X1 n=1 Tax=Erythrolamprus reginae TaxID=121349 RepID=UPI00396CA672
MDERERLLTTLGELTDKELQTFAFLLPGAIPRGKRNTDSRVDLAEVILSYYAENALEVLVDVLNKIPRRDLVLKLQGRPRRGVPRCDGTEEAREVAAAAAAVVAGLFNFLSSHDPQESPSKVSSASADPQNCLPPSLGAPSKLLSQEQLMKVASKMGKNWKQIGIAYLGVEISRLEQFEEENPRNMVMQIFSMLWYWRNREKNATGCDLYNILNKKGVELDADAYNFLLE